MIPKIIHYCWFGGAKKPKLIQKCIQSWREICPDWKIIEWNEKNYNINKNKFISEAYKKKKWAYVADYARFDVLNKFGGVYFDTDVELLKPLPQYLLEEEAFTGFELPYKVAPGLVYGSIANQYFLTSVLSKYETSDYTDKVTVVSIVTDLLVKYGLELDNSEQIVKGVRIMPTEYFGCFNHEIQDFEKTENTISIHHYYASWRPWYSKLRFKVIKYTARLLGKNRYLSLKKRIFSIIKNSST